MDTFPSGQLCADPRLDFCKGLSKGSNNSWDMRLQNSNGLFKTRLSGDSRRSREQGASFSPRQTLERHEALLDLSPLRQCPINGSHPINKDLLPAAVHGSSKKNRKHPVWKDATLDGRRKRRSAAWTGLHAGFSNSQRI